MGICVYRPFIGNEKGQKSNSRNHREKTWPEEKGKILALVEHIEKYKA